MHCVRGNKEKKKKSKQKSRLFRLLFVLFFSRICHQATNSSFWCACGSKQSTNNGEKEKRDQKGFPRIPPSFACFCLLSEQSHNRTQNVSSFHKSRQTSGHDWFSSLKERRNTKDAGSSGCLRVCRKEHVFPFARIEKEPRARPLLLCVCFCACVRETHTKQNKTKSKRHARAFNTARKTPRPSSQARAGVGR
jgi:hypothetical protein